MVGLRTLREASGMSQAALAERSGVTRQLVAAAEAGRHAPSVDAALRLARTLGTTVEELCTPAPTSWVTVPGTTVAEGELVTAVRVGARLIVAPCEGERLTRGASWGAADGVIERQGVRLFPGARTDGALVLGCEPALGVAEELLAGFGARSVTALAATSAVAVDALREGLCHAAVVHGPEGSLPEPPPEVDRMHLGSWRVGLATADSSAPQLAQALSGDVPLVQRERSAASQQALERAAAALGATVPAGPIGAGHLDVARRVRVGGGIGVTYEPAAIRLGLRFAPLESHVVEVWFSTRWTDLPAVQALGELLVGHAFRQRVLAIGGYDLAGIGTERSAA